MLLAVMGNPIAHSLSPAIYHAFAKQAELACVCEKILVQDGQFNHCLAEFIQCGGVGTGITVPLKTIAFEAMDECSLEAHEACAVSMVHIHEDGKKIGERRYFLNPAFSSDSNRISKT